MMDKNLYDLARYLVNHSVRMNAFTIDSMAEQPIFSPFELRQNRLELYESKPYIYYAL